MSSPVSYARQGAIGVITVDNPPVNALSYAVRQGLAESVQAGLADSGAQALVVICTGRTFIAGADIREFGKPAPGPAPFQVFDILENASKLVLAAIHGTAFGGGLEIAMCCHYRCAVPSAQFGQPEVKLGLIPGAGGTQRLPRLIGVQPALNMITSGDPIRADEALKLGLVDHVVPGDLRDGALKFAERLVAERRPLRKIRDLNDKLQVPAGFFDDFKKSLQQRARGNEAPLRCLEAVRAATELDFDKGMALERKLFTEAVASAQSAALRYIFFAEREVSKIPGLPKETPVLPVRTGAVMGAGTMGTGIAMNFANAGIPVVLLDVNAQQLEKGMANVRKNYESTVSKGRLSQAEMDKRVALITPTQDFAALAAADYVIEAVFEEMDLKKEVFGRLDAACKPGAIMATNTSTLDVNQIAAATRRPQSVIGMHFFSPANVMRLLEIVRGQKTAPDIIATSMDLAKRMSKVGVLVGVCDGFVGNRMLHQYTREASFLLEEGALPQQVDKVITDFGFPMGPFAMGDLAGLDVGWRIRKGRAAKGHVPAGRQAGAIADRLCEMGRFGQKTSAGYYKYEAGARKPIPDPVVEEIIVKESAARGFKRRPVSDEEILARCLYPMINEGAKILEEGIALRASDIDVIWINGYGFPAHRGGPMFYADSIGVKNVLDALLKFQEQHGDVWKPSPLLKKLADEGKRLTA